jgi:cytochrome P450 monooxygenase OleP
MLGAPMKDRAQISAWTDRILRLQGMFQPDRLTVEEGNAATTQFMTYMRGVVEARGAGSGNDVLGALMGAEENGDRLTPEEVARCAVFLANAGFSTTRSLIASATVALLENREQWEMLVADPSLVAEAVEEALRYDSLW